MASKSVSNRIQGLSASVDGAAAILASVADGLASVPDECRQIYAVQDLLERLSGDLDQLAVELDKPA